MTLYLCTELVTISSRGPPNVSNFRFERQWKIEQNYWVLRCKFGIKFRPPKISLHVLSVSVVFMWKISSSCYQNSFSVAKDTLQRYSQSRQPHGSRPFHDLPSTIPSFHCSNREAVNGGTASGGRSCCWYFWEWPVTNSPIHKAAGSLVTGHSLQNGKMSKGNRHAERPPDPVLYGGRPSGGFVNRAVKSWRICE